MGPAGYNVASARQHSRSRDCGLHDFTPEKALAHDWAGEYEKKGVNLPQTVPAHCEDPRMPSSLLERSAEQDVLCAAVDALLETGNGSVVLVTGEAGIGKTSVVDRLLDDIAGKVRILQGACDDLVAGNPLGPLREAARETGGRLEAALVSGRVNEVLDAAVHELSGRSPVALVIEDVHWADDATIDVLTYVARRIESLNVLLVVTYRDDAVDQRHPLQRLLGILAGHRAIRLRLQPLSEAAVRDLAVGSHWDPAQLHELTGGNPFYLTETLASPSDAAVPNTVFAAVMARFRQLSTRCRTALERICVVPGIVDFPLAEDLLGDDLDALAEAERNGIVEMRRDGLAFRHELVRRAIEGAVPGLRRRQLQRDVTAVLRTRGESELSRVVHHALQAGDVEVVAEFAPRAARRSAASGSHREALTHYRAALGHEELLEPHQLGEVLDEFAWELYNAHRFDEAVHNATRAADLFARIGDSVAQGRALMRLSRHLYMAGETDAARAAAEQSVEQLDGNDSLEATAYAVAGYGALLALDDEATRAVQTLARAETLADEAGRPELRSLCLNYQSLARADLDGAGRIALLRLSLQTAIGLGEHEYVARGYTNLCEMLYRYGCYDELADVVAQGLTFTRERGFWSHTFNLEVHQALLEIRRGDWAHARADLERTVSRYADPGMLAVYSVPPYARLTARMDGDRSGHLQREAWERAQRQRSLLGLGFAGIALVEWAWLNDRADVAEQVRGVWRHHADRPSAGPLWAELQRYCVRAGLTAEHREGPEHTGHEPWDSGLRGDWREAARRWQAIGDPFEQALELADSGEIEPTLEALRLLDGLGAAPAASKVRGVLRSLGMRSVPRGPTRHTRVNPAGLTDRQLDVLGLLSEGLTNSEIADRLVVSVRTVDHHVSSILAKLAVSSRRAAISVARSWEQAS
jgi:DNA-binding CsgD family transcriptional regulator/tetratricopeptide (TPR) repeat protein